MESRPEGPALPHTGLAGPASSRPPVSRNAPARRTSRRRINGVSPTASRYRHGILTVITHNIHGFGSKGKQLSQLWHSLHADIVLVQETLLNSSSFFSAQGQLPSWHCIWAAGPSGPTGRPTGGTAILIRKRLLIQHGGHLNILSGTIAKGPQGRILELQAKWLGHHLHLASIYLPNQLDDQITYVQKHLAARARDTDHHRYTRIWGGDFNFVPDPPIDRTTKGAPAAETHRDARTATVWATHLPNLTDAFRHHHPSTRVYTHFHPQGASRLDRLYVCPLGLPYLLGSAIESSTIPGPTGHYRISDHRPAVLHFLHRCPLLPIPHRSGFRRTRAPKVRLDFLDDPELAQQYREGVEAAASVAPDDPLELLRWWPEFKTTVANIARGLHQAFCRKRALTALTARSHGGTEQPPPNRLERVVQRYRQPSLWETQHARHPFLHHRELPHPGLSQRLRPRSDLTCGPSLVSPRGDLASAPGDCADIMIDHYASMSAKPTTQAEAQQEVLAALAGSPTLPAETGDEATVTEAEVRKMLTRTKITAPGLDGLTVKVYKAARNTFVPLLARLFSAIGTCDLLPPGFHSGVISPLHKRGDRTRPSNYRPIALLNSDYRLLAAILGSRLKPQMAEIIDPAQTAFLPGRHIGENIWAMQLLPHILAADGRTAFIAHCDFAKAYDTVDRDFLLAIMETLGAGTQLLRWVRLFLQCTNARAQVMGRLSKQAAFNAGVRQGCPLSPLLYLFVGQALLRFLQSRNIGVELPSGPDLPAIKVPSSGGPVNPPRMWNTALTRVSATPAPSHVPLGRVTAIQYADDCSVFLSSLDAVPPFLQAMDTFAAASGQRLNRDKTVLLPIGTQRPLSPGPTAHGLRIILECNVLGVTLRAFDRPATAPWTDILERMLRCHDRLTGLTGLSAFGRGIATASYGSSRLLHAAEYVGLPEAIHQKIESAVASVVDRNTSTAQTGNAESRPHGFAGLRRDLIHLPPGAGGFGALPLRAHLTARSTKWAIRMLLDGSTSLWSRLAWLALAKACPPQPSHPALIWEHMAINTYAIQWLTNEATLSLEGTPEPLRRILTAVQAFPKLGRRVAAPPSLTLQHDWISPLTLYRWRLYRPTSYLEKWLDLGTPAWPFPPSMPKSPGGMTLDRFTVRFGTRVLCAAQMTEVSKRFRLFVEEVGGSLPTDASPEIVTCSTLSRLWSLPVPNPAKETFWRCFHDALPTAARLHQRWRCGCNAPLHSPGRKHHFHDCPIAVAVADTIAAKLPASTDTPLWPAIRAAKPPPNISQPIWDIVCLAACAAMDAGRRHFVHATQFAQPRATRTPALITESTAFAVAYFWEELDVATACPLPATWRTGIPDNHPFIRWSPATSRWVVPH